MEITPFYRLNGALYEPLSPAQGYWVRSHQNGVAVGGLLALLCDTHQASAAMRTCRFTLDILRGVPVEPFAVTCQLVRDGARVQLLEAHLKVGSQVFARATALRVRTIESPPSPEAECHWPPPESVEGTSVMRDQVVGAPIETRLVKGSMKEIGPGSFWARFNTPLVEGRETTPMARVVMAADIGGGPSSVVDGRAWSFANLDLTVYLTRPPVGEWIYGDSQTSSAGDGTATVTTRLGDRTGWVGMANQVLFVAPRERHTDTKI